MTVTASQPKEPATVLLTVGSTSFTPLVAAFLSPNTLALIPSPAYVLAQVGNSKLPEGWELGRKSLKAQGKQKEVVVEVVKFMDDLEAQVEAAEVVVSHAGAGSILSFLRPSSSSPSLSSPDRRRELILVPNDTLMDSHQTDLAVEMKKSGWATVCSSSELPETLGNVLKTEIMKRTVPPPLDQKKVSRILDSTLGYA